ncbi:hypothetical protein H4Q26_003353 [Puccinia striiformis f. sp. tritici PST-130]|nr:hypothetical protein H4Q26_003353 [Puccinia striiformis f. sp. tritici PST-130]
MAVCERPRLVIDRERQIQERALRKPRIEHGESIAAWQVENGIKKRKSYFDKAYRQKKIEATLKAIEQPDAGYGKGWM